MSIVLYKKANNCFLLPKCFSLPYTLPDKSFRSVRFFMFLNEVSSAHQGCFICWKKNDKQ